MPSLKLTVRDWTSAEAQNKLVSQPPFFRFHVSLCKNEGQPPKQNETKYWIDNAFLKALTAAVQVDDPVCSQLNKNCPKERCYRLYLFDPPLILVVWLLLHWSLLGNQTIPAASWRILQSSVVFPIYKTSNASKQTSYSPREINSFDEQEQELPIAFCLYIISHSIHVWYIFIHIYHKINSSCR